MVGGNSGEASNPEKTSDATRAAFLLSQRESLYERLTAVLDFIKAQPSQPNFKQVKARFSFSEKIYEEYNALETQILQFNASTEQKNRITYKKERVSVDDLFAEIHEQYGLLSEQQLQTSMDVTSQKLPKLLMPKFSGSFREWQSFYEIYSTMVHTAPISNIEKFQRLKSCLHGEPLRLIDHFTLSGDNYDLALQTLKDRYDNPRVAANSYLHSLLNFKALANESHASLQSFLSHHLDAIKAYKALKIPDHFDYLLFQICYCHLDKKLQKSFDEKFPVSSFPTYENLMNFAQTQLRTLELHAIENEKGSKPLTKQFSFNVTQCDERGQSTAAKCYACPNNHPLIKCPKFLELPVSEKYDILKNNYLCFNCFRKHQRKLCSSESRCKKCGKAHHTLLHSARGEGSKDGLQPYVSSSSNKSEDKKVVAHTQLNRKSPPTSVLLGTAQGFVSTSDGNSTIPVRILLDPGSQVSCISEGLVSKLDVEIDPKVTEIKGVSDTSIHSKGKVCCTIYTTPKRTKSFRFDLIILPTISASLPEVHIPDAIKQKFMKYKLADPRFDQSGGIDILLGADYYYDIILDKRVIKGKPNGVPSEFGIVLIGEVPSLQNVSTSQTFLVTLNTLEQSLSKFWETEELQNVTPPEESWCERFFQETFKRNSSGRFVVALPFNSACPDEFLGDNRKNALQRLQAMERRFAKNEDLKREYSAFLAEYVALGHMSLAKNSSSYVIPHHAVCKESTTTKLRVVFDASNESDKGTSLNQLLRKGPKLQSDIFITISGFRKFKVALVSDIKMMYRQILIREQDRPYQRIYWRESSQDSLREYELNTVTYGLASSSYLAQRVIRQLVAEDGENFPLASNALLNQIYVDDIVSGGETVEEALQLYKELIQLLGQGGFFPRKWSSSSSHVLDCIPSEHKETPLKFETEDEIMFKVLGLRWDPKLDSFTYQIERFQGVPTKRTVLSYISKMFDPLGWLTPFIFRCKHFMQLLWLEGLGWDDPIPQRLQQHWNKTVSEVQCLSQVRIPRHIPVSAASKLQIIGFCDASERGFAAVLYIKCVVSGSVSILLLGAKSKVAPVKPLSIPRLELNAAFLLAKLFDSFKPFLSQLPEFSVSLFSDSKVVLGWLKTAPHKLKTYVCNRVVEIMNRTSPNFWSHIKSEENAADCASRGLDPQEMVENTLWWRGPEILYQEHWEPDSIDLEPDSLPELRVSAQVLVATTDKGVEGIIKTFEKFSSLSKLNRVFAYVLRFPELARKRFHYKEPLNVRELKLALHRFLWLNQVFYFAKERMLIRNGATVPNLESLSVFIDQNDLVRVGGRLNNAPLPYDTKHPFLVPYKSKLARLIIEYYHKVTLHGGPQFTRSVVQSQYWIPKIGNLIKSVIFNCKNCRRHKAPPIIPVMAALPPSRFDQVRPFLRVGTDFAGPFTLKETSRRKALLLKAYACLFVCFSTKAVHIEIVTSLTTDAFLAAVDRFVARRGLCAFLHSDNGTNFVGAARKLSEVEEFLSRNSTVLAEQGSTRNIQWIFNPPAAPHFGGLWEAAVKSFKFHLNRVASAHVFTIEEFTTLACRIEAILNSRPLCPLPSNPSDSETFLTPGHFLIGAPLLSVPEIPLTDIKINRLNRWQLIAQCTQNFWKKWSASYLQTLLPRKKWQWERDSIKVGDVTFLKNQNTNPLSWPLARVEELLKGPDGTCRVVKVRCGGRTLTRPVRSLCKVFDDVDTTNVNVGKDVTN